MADFQLQCNPGEILVDVGADSPVCMASSDAAQVIRDARNIPGAYQPRVIGTIAGPMPVGNMGTVNVQASSSDSTFTNVLMIGGVALLFLFLRRR